MGVPIATALPITAAVSAVLLHQAVLKRVEVDHLTLRLVGLSTASYNLFSWYIDFALATVTWTSFYTTLTVTTLLYRAFFHPLRNFPGPFGAKLSKWWTVKKTIDSHFGYFKDVNFQLRRQYGDYVRTGPRELSIFDPNAIQPILGFSSKTTIGPYYDVFEKSLHLNRDKAWHRQRRKVWDNGMKQSLADYAPRIEEFTTELLERLERANGNLIPLNQFCIHYSYDVMAALVFGKSMGFTKGQQSDVADRLLNIIAGSLHALGLLCHVPWFMNAIAILTSSIGPMKLWEDWTAGQLAERRAMKDPRPDFMMHLLEATPQDEEGDRLLFGESRLIITAGSDTTALNLTNIFIQMALHPEYQDGLRRELSESTYSSLKSQPLLDAIIYESMRLWPAVAFPSQRVTPPEGLQIPGGRFIPGDIVVGIPPMTMARDERNFARPDEFIPERWTTQPELCTNKTAFMPFGFGPYLCAGKNLAMLELRSVVARVIQGFEVVLPENFKEEAYFGGIEDHWVLGVPKQQIRFVPRKAH